MPTKKKSPISSIVLTPYEVEQRIFIIRGQKVMLDYDLAVLYDVSTTRLNEQVSRNIERFPEDFAFYLNDQEVESLMSQIAISKPGRGGRRKPPRVFTEQGIAMLSSVLRSDRAVEVNIQIMRTFVQLRYLSASNKELAERLDKLEENYDEQFAIVFQAIRELMEPPEPKKKHPIGFRITTSEEEDA